MPRAQGKGESSRELSNFDGIGGNQALANMDQGCSRGLAPPAAQDNMFAFSMGAGTPTATDTLFATFAPIVL